MHETLTGLLERAEFAVASAEGLVPADLLADVAGVVESGRVRLQYPDEVTVVALAGGTGSGKSSLFNVLTGTDAAEVGVTRPITSRPLAAVPSRHALAMERFLAEIGVDRSIVVDSPDAICLIDLPDNDSVETEHRHRVESVLPRVDAMVWVVDPEKYRDAVLHREYLMPLSAFAAQFIVVLNQTDRLAAEDLGPVLADLGLALAEDGLGGVPVVAVAAAPLSGPPIGIDRLEASIAALAAESRLLYSKLLTDLESAASEMASALGPNVPFLEPASVALGEASERLARSDVGGAVEGLISFLEEMASRVGVVAADELRANAASLPEAVMRASEIGGQPESHRRWWRREPARPDPTPKIEAMLTEALGPARGVMERRARAVASVADLAIAARTVAAGRQPGSLTLSREVPVRSGPAARSVPS